MLPILLDLFQEGLSEVGCIFELLLLTLTFVGPHICGTQPVITIAVMVSGA